MEIRRRKKKSIVDILCDAIVPLASCAFVVFLVAILCLLTSLVRTGGTPGMRTRTEDAQYQLNNRQIHHESSSSKNSGILEPDSLGSLEKSRVEKLRLPRVIETVDDSLPYDIHRCPSVIPENYPYAWSILDVLEHWNPDDTRIPDTIHQGLCALDWTDPAQRTIAVHYRKSEVPFIIKNHPQIWRTVDRWSDYDYLHGKLGDDTYRNEHSQNNHMMYWKSRGGKDPPGWKPPTENAVLSYPDWYQKAKVLEDDPDSSATAEHYYFRFSGGKGGRGDWLYDDLPFFNPSTQNDITMVEPDQARGINCRLGSRGTIAELHYDESRNFILILQGQKRYILAHPDQCINMELYPTGHPSARHSLINWSDPESWMHGGTNFRNGMVNEVVLDAGDGLYLPTYWFHFIVSLTLNYQCNARSGISYEYQKPIRDCGF